MSPPLINTVHVYIWASTIYETWMYRCTQFTATFIYNFT